MYAGCFEIFFETVSKCIQKYSGIQTNMVDIQVLHPLVLNNFFLQLVILSILHQEAADFGTYLIFCLLLMNCFICLRKTWGSQTSFLALSSISFCIQNLWRTLLEQASFAVDVTDDFSISGDYILCLDNAWCWYSVFIF